MSESRPTTTQYAIVTRGLTRYFAKKAAVKDLDLVVPRGSVFALLGRNGSGKTTTIRMLLGLLQPTRGTSQVLGRDSQELTSQIRGRIGYLAEGHFAYGWMRIREAADFQAATFPLWNSEIFTAIVEYFGLNPEARIATLSRGERAGLCLALTLAPEPELLILDDPALGLDPVARRSLVEAMLAVARRDDRTILFSSHLLDDVERVADQIAILENGTLKVHTTVEDFRRRVGCWILRFADPPRAGIEVRGLVYTRLHRNELEVTIANPGSHTEAELAATGALSVERVPLSMENAVIAYLQRGGRTRALLEAVGGLQ